jgi:preprotein translocase subunit SecA
MDGLREGISLRAYGQRDPLVEYKREAYNLFMDLMDRIYEEIANSMFRSATSLDAMEEFFQSLSGMQVHQEISALSGELASQTVSSTQTASSAPVRRRPAPRVSGAPPPGMDLPSQSRPAPVRQQVAKVGRNDPCPCGSGRKYKKCCGSE